MSAYEYRSFLKMNSLPESALAKSASPDDRSGAVYLEDDDLRLAAEIAIVTQRPLLLRGEPGCGKSSFAPFAARNLGWRYYETTVTARTEARDLLWRFDALARLRDANARVANTDPRRYITPGVLWWAFNRAEALRFSQERQALLAGFEEKPRDLEPSPKTNAERDALRAVVLIDEIDKAEPEMPNGLLEALAINRFTVDEWGQPVERVIPARPEVPRKAADFGSLLIVVTTNEERDLPAAFLRRCVVHTIVEQKGREAQVARLVEIARLHFKKAIEARRGGDALVVKVAEACWRLREEAKRKGRRAPSTAEFLDALYACFHLNITPEDTARWLQMENAIFRKETEALGPG